MLPLLAKAALGAGAVLLAGAGTVRYVFHYGVMTPERQAMFDTAMHQTTDAGKLRALAAQFHKWGLFTAAKQLLARAASIEAPPSVKAQRQAVANQAAATTDPAKAGVVQNVANAFAASGDPATAAALTAHAQQLAQTPPTSPLPDIPIPQPFSAAPPVHPAVAQGDGLAAVQTRAVEAPRGYVPPPSPPQRVGDNTGGAMAD